MSMKVVYLKDTPDHPEGWEGFIPRSLGRRLCQQEVVIPYSVKDFHSGYKEMMTKMRVEKKPVKAPRKKAVSAKVETREKAITNGAKQ